VIKWIPVGEQPVPQDGKTYLAWVPFKSSRPPITTVRYNLNGVGVIGGGLFTFDCPPVEYWAEWEGPNGETP
jgi:hypothetical protein